jgi:hypothetical protein
MEKEVQASITAKSRYLQESHGGITKMERRVSATATCPEREMWI